MQANYAGALGLAYINIMYAPYLRGKSAKEIRQIAQGLIFGGAQNAFSRGGQTIFLDFNIHSGVPGYLKTVPAVGPSGRYMLRRADGEVARLEEVVRPEKDANGNRMMELLLAEADGSRRCVLREVADARTDRCWTRRCSRTSRRAASASDLRRFRRRGARADPRPADGLGGGRRQRACVRIPEVRLPRQRGDVHRSGSTRSTSAPARWPAATGRCISSSTATR
jgi:hypothetical protein